MKSTAVGNQRIMSVSTYSDFSYHSQTEIQPPEKVSEATATLLTPTQATPPLAILPAEALRQRE